MLKIHFAKTLIIFTLFLVKVDISLASRKSCSGHINTLSKKPSCCASSLDLSEKTDWGKRVHLKTTNGVELEGILYKQTIESVANKMMSWLEGHDSKQIKMVRLEKLTREKFELTFEFNGKQKIIIIKKESLDSADVEGATGVELAGQVIETADDVRLFFEVQEKFYKFGVREDTLFSGIHNHNGLLGLIGREVESPHDKEIIEFANNFSKIESGLLSYFGTHPYRNSIAGRSKGMNYISTSEGKNQGLVLSRAGLLGKYKTLEIRIYNGVQNPEYLAEALNFDNAFLAAYFDTTSGLKEWMNQSEEISLKELFERLGLKYKKREYKYSAFKYRFRNKNDYLNVFGKDYKKALEFLEHHILKNIDDPRTKHNSFGELYNYLGYLMRTDGELSENVINKLRLFLRNIRQHYKQVGKNFVLSDTTISSHFEKLNFILKKEVLGVFWPHGIESISSDEINELLNQNFYKAFKNYPFTEREFNFLYGVARKHNNEINASDIMLLRYSDINHHVLNLNELNDDFNKKVYGHLMKINNLLYPEVKAHLRQILE